MPPRRVDTETHSRDRPAGLCERLCSESNRASTTKVEGFVRRKSDACALSQTELARGA